MNRRRWPLAERPGGPSAVVPSDFSELSKEADERVRRFVEEYEAERERARRRDVDRRVADDQRRPASEATT